MKKFLFWLFLATLVLGPVAGVMAQGNEEDKEPTTITVDPVADINPVKTQHTLIATVLDKKNNPIAGQRVEWILARQPKAVGDIVEHDDMGATVGSALIQKNQQPLYGNLYQQKTCRFDYGNSQYQ